MRPLRLEVEGFAAFRDPTVVDFAGVELFALTGPTGSGKTTVLDAVVFALYGNVPRLADQRAVAPVIAQGLAEARVRLDFTASGRRFSAVRVVRRTKTGASTAEARLQQDDRVLAGTADEVTAEVQALLGMSYEHFTKCVVLPQGEFARFLHDKPKDRQDLLVSLLDLGLYGAMAALAGQRASAARAEVEVLDARLGDLVEATPAALAAAEQRVAALVALVDDVDAEQERLDGLAAEASRARSEAEAHGRAAGELAALVVPAGLAGFATAALEAADVLAAREADVAAAEAATGAAEAALEGAGDRTELSRLRDDVERAGRHRVQQRKGGAVLDERRATVDAAVAHRGAAEAAAAAAGDDAEAAALAHRAHAVRADLVAGEPCPVCERPVTAVPAVAAPPELDEARGRRRRAESALEGARDALATAERARDEVQAKLDAIAEQLAELDARTAAAGDPALPDVDARLEAVAAAERQLVAAREAERRARRAEVAARTDVRRAADAEAGARRAFDAARDAVAAHGPPPRTGADLAGEWEALAGWAHAEGARRRAAADEGAAAAAGHDAARRTLLDDLARRCQAQGVAVGPGRSVRDAAVAAHATAAASVERLRADVAVAAGLDEQRTDAEERRAVGASLAQHLNARNFEKWVLDEALLALASGATETLHTLSGGQHSLTVDPRSGGFLVVDHTNADETRPARTLSGGETFLASLALALALADRLAGLAAGGAARLESIFLDEGFGTLDPATLDVVTAAIEELGARGRVVGVVSHVPELAERMPTRFEVERVGNASSVVRVDR